MWFCALLKTSTPGAIVEPERDQGLNHLLQVSWCNPLLKVELAARLQQLAQDFIHTNFEYPYDEDPPPPWAACLCAQILLWGRINFPLSSWSLPCCILCPLQWVLPLCTEKWLFLSCNSYLLEDNN